MRRIRYQVACSLDGYIAGPNGEYDWIVPDPEIDFTAMFAQYDTLLMGRGTYELVKKQRSASAGMKIVVLSRTERQEDNPDATIISDNIKAAVEELRALPGKDIWLFGGGEAFRTLLELGLVDTVELAIIPILLGGGLPFLPAPAQRSSLTLTSHRVYQQSGIVMLTYSVTSLRGS